MFFKPLAFCRPLVGGKRMLREREIDTSPFPHSRARQSYWLARIHALYHFENASRVNVTANRHNPYPPKTRYGQLQ